MKRMIKQVMLFSDSEETPCFGETTTRIGIDDKAAGMFITISQNSDDGYHELKFNPEDIDQVIGELKIMQKQITDFNSTIVDSGNE